MEQLETCNLGAFLRPCFSDPGREIKKRSRAFNTTAALPAENSRLWSGDIGKAQTINGTVTWAICLTVFDCAEMVLIGALSYIQTKCIIWGQHYIAVS